MSTTATTQPEATQQPNPVLGLPDDSSKEYADNKCGPGFSTGTRASVPGPRLRLSRRAIDVGVEHGHPSDLESGGLRGTPCPGMAT